MTILHKTLIDFSILNQAFFQEFSTSWLLSVMRLLSIITKPLKLAIMPDNHHVHWLLVVGIYVNTKWLLIGHYRIWTVFSTIEPLALFFYKKPVYRKENHEGDMCSEMFCCKFETKLSYFHFLQILLLHQEHPVQLLRSLTLLWWKSHYQYYQ